MEQVLSSTYFNSYPKFRLITPPKENHTTQLRKSSWKLLSISFPCLCFLIVDKLPQSTLCHSFVRFLSFLVSPFNSSCFYFLCRKSLTLSLLTCMNCCDAVSISHTLLNQRLFPFSQKMSIQSQYRDRGHHT